MKSKYKVLFTRDNQVRFINAKNKPEALRIARYWNECEGVTNVYALCNGKEINWKK